MYNPLKVSLENIIPLTEARDHFSQIVTEVQKDKLYVLTKGGKPAVAIIDVKYLETLTGGEIKEENVENEIQKNPAKVGRPEMVKHDTTPPPPPPPKPVSPPPAPKPASTPPPPPTPTPPPQVQPTPQPKPTPPPPPKPAPAPTPPSKPVGTLDIHPIADQDDQRQANTQANESQNIQLEPDDQAGPAQYAGSADSGEPDDMPID